MQIILKETKKYYLVLEDHGYSLYAQNSGVHMHMESVEPHMVHGLVSRMDIESPEENFIKTNNPGFYKKATEYFNKYGRITHSLLTSLIIDMYYDTADISQMAIVEAMLDISFPQSNNLYIEILKNNLQEILTLSRQEMAKNNSVYGIIPVTGNSVTDKILHRICLYLYWHKGTLMVAPFSDIYEDSEHIFEVLYDCISDIKTILNANNKNDNISMHYFLKKLIDLCPVPYDKSKLNL